MPGLNEALFDVSAIAEVSGGNIFKNKLTDTIRRDIPGIDQIPRGVPRALVLVLVGRILHKESNKANVNPKVPFLPMRLL